MKTYAQTPEAKEEIGYIEQERQRLLDRAQTEANPHLRRYLLFQRDFLLVRLNTLLNAPQGV